MIESYRHSVDRRRLIRSAIKVRETSWRDVHPLGGLPEYDSFTDKCCPWALALQHNVFKKTHAEALLKGLPEEEAVAAARRKVSETIEPLREKRPKDRWALLKAPSEVAAGRTGDEARKSGAVFDASGALASPVRSPRPVSGNARVPDRTSSAAMNLEPSTAGNVTWQESPRAAESEVACLRVIVRRESLLAEVWFGPKKEKN